MKLSKRFILLALVSSLFLTGCGDDGGFSVVKSNEPAGQQPVTRDDLNGDNTDTIANSGSTGGNKDEHKDDTDTQEDPNGNGQSTDQQEIPVIDLGSQITTFKFTFVKSDEEMYANVSFEDDPFDTKYDFAYYTVNDQKLEKSEYRNKEMVDEVETYEIFLGSNESGTYVLKFYNSNNKQYGRVNVAVKFKDSNTNTPYISVAFNIVKLRVVSLSFAIQNVFKKIGDFFSNLFNADKMSL